ncbi:(E)-beta-farnesene synthase [Zea mays]|uniref:(E)-beta-farnesene synthase n=1 Tax=Zea mays TaxID=4577 RepID=A0A3L6G7A2_MAIZE|nr:(E)-beta-farnesene synthase [Zea mays]
MATSGPVLLVSQAQQRKSRTYTPSPWGDFFLHHVPCTPSQLLSMKERAKVKEQQVRQMIHETIASSDLLRKMELVDTLQRLGVDYHYNEEIDQLLCSIYDHHDDGGDGLDDLYVTSLRFYLLRKHGYTISSDLSFARDRMVELHFWMLGVIHDPYCSRIMIVKIFVFISLFDDLMDNYSTTEESNVFTATMERWDEQMAQQLPAGLKALLVRIFNATNKIEEELKLQGNMHAELIKKMVINSAKFYHAEVKWRDEHFVPTSLEEHLQKSIPTSACMQMANLALVSLGNVTTREDVEWVFTFPKIIRGACIVGRIANDIVSHEREQASSDHVASTVQTCMKQYNVTIKEANEKLRAVIEEAWMDIVQDSLEQERPRALLDIAINVARVADFMYKREDAYTLSFVIKDIIASMYIYSV